MCTVTRHQQARSDDLSLTETLDKSWPDCEPIGSVTRHRDELDRQIEELDGIVEVRRSMTREEGDYIEQAQKQVP